MFSKGGTAIQKNFLDVSTMRFINYYALYSDIVDAISIYNVSKITSNAIDLIGEEARVLTSKIEYLDQQINSLRLRLKKETQFNRKMEMNIEIKKLEKQKNGNRKALLLRVIKHYERTEL